MRLLVEGDQHLAAGLRNGQEAQGFAVEAGRRLSCPTAKGASGTKVEGLDNGADDHLTKPFSSAGSPGSGRCRIEASQTAPLRARAGTVRLRTMVAAAVVVGVAMTVGAVMLVVLLRDTLTREVRTAAGLRAAEVAAVLESGATPGGLTVDDAEDLLIQVLDQDRIDRFELPWWLIGGGMVLAVVTATAAAWWPARTVARIPVTVALSARPPRPKPAHRSALAAGLLLLLGVAILAAGVDSVHDRANLLPVIAGTIAIVLAIPLGSPLAIRAAAAVAGRSPSRSGWPCVTWPATRPVPERPWPPSASAWPSRSPS